MKTIVVGTTSRLKLDAVEAAAIGHPDFTIIGVSTSSGINEQPLGREETCLGASNRAEGAQEQHPNADFYLGIENGVRGNFHDERYADWAVIHLLTTRIKDGTVIPVEIRVDSMEVTVPTDVVEEMYERGPETTTCGAISAERHGHPKDDPHVLWSGGTTCRKDILIQALKVMFDLIDPR